jgi:hypothetical protein
MCLWPQKNRTKYPHRLHRPQPPQNVHLYWILLTQFPCCRPTHLDRSLNPGKHKRNIKLPKLPSLLPISPSLRRQHPNRLPNLNPTRSIMCRTSRRCSMFPRIHTNCPPRRRIKYPPRPNGTILRPCHRRSPRLL